MNTAQALERMRQVIRRQHKALATEDSPAQRRVQPRAQKAISYQFISSVTQKAILGQQGIAIPRGTALDEGSLIRHVLGEDVNARVTSWTTERG
jgi:hypothetical protein